MAKLVLSELGWDFFPLESGVGKPRSPSNIVGKMLIFGFLFQTLISLKDDGSLVQEQEWDGKKTIITRKLVDGQLVVVSSVPLSDP